MLNLWLDGGFWGPEIRRGFIKEVEWMRKSVFDHVLPSFPDPEIIGQEAVDNAWCEYMNSYSDGNDDPGDYAQVADDEGFVVYQGYLNMRQSAVNLSVAMLWHLIEQQMLIFHMRQVLKMGEEDLVRKDPQIRRKLFTTDSFYKRLEEAGCSIRDVSVWPKIEELRLVANSVKHGPGPSLDNLYLIRPDLLVPIGMDDSQFVHGRHPSFVENPAAGEDIYVRDEDLASYFQVAKAMWQEFSIAVEDHSQKQKDGTSL